MLGTTKEKKRPFGGWMIKLKVKMLLVTTLTTSIPNRMRSQQFISHVLHSTLNIKTQAAR